MLKRGLDVIVAAGGLAIFAPIIFLLIILIRRDSKGPGIFAQDRIGRHGRRFRCYKLRTMSLDAPNVPTHVSNAAQVTRIGAKLRYTKLDELPQLWNVLRGDMSLVGPRPCLPTQTELLQERNQRNILAVRPGITGLAQIRGVDMSHPKLLAEIDAEYIGSQTLSLDAKIIFLTLFSRSGRGDQLTN